VFIATLVLAGGALTVADSSIPMLLNPDRAVPSVAWVSADGTLAAHRPAARATFGELFAPALVYSAESAVVVFRGSDRYQLDLVGRLVQIVLRVLGPIFLGLTVLAIRSQVKR
jgi:hypothetical protein